MKYLFFLIILIACNNNQYKLAEDGLDAAREFENACLKGDFKKAKYYIVQNQKNNNLIFDISDQYFKNTEAQKKELGNASIRVISTKEIDSISSLIILGNSFDARIDTLFTIKKNAGWLVDSQK
jgi:hypothetical protein